MNTRATVRSRLGRGSREDSENVQDEPNAHQEAFSEAVENAESEWQFTQEVQETHQEIETAPAGNSSTNFNSLDQMMGFWDEERSACLGELRQVIHQQSTSTERVLRDQLSSFTSTMQQILQSQTAMLQEVVRAVQGCSVNRSPSAPPPNTNHMPKAPMQALHLKPMPFSGSEDWESYFLQFSAIAERNGWDDSAKAAASTSVLSGTAREVLAQVGSVYTYDRLVKALEARFGFRHQEQRFMTLLMSRVQDSNEDISTFHQALQTLARRALLEISHGTESMLVHLFVRGLRDQSLREKVLTVGPKSMDEAISVALRLETVQQIKPHAIRQLETTIQEQENVSRAVQPTVPDRVQAVPRQQRFVWPRSPVCWRCGLVGHLARVCPYPPRAGSSWSPPTHQSQFQPQPDESQLALPPTTSQSFPRNRSTAPGNVQKSE
ncbi:hypothetical protein GE061_004360 [Apolygus lucorum]|uniref:Uncharacterized protein n=1 Tax=Apolygus lucorum TaxID=248454 RepID=A0A6A4J7K7_APOLU|nr:hypothetical protein GE061_004360 [Apolygus lucorum]